MSKARRVSPGKSSSVVDARNSLYGEAPWPAALKAWAMSSKPSPRNGGVRGEPGGVLLKWSLASVSARISSRSD